ncbi:CoA-transferase [Sedimentibacter sp.]|uniref:CoA-transferase subunit beta n=1 Tax=Sedimentibacter sp. TaxID=1960295 RepID=UPI0028A8CB80|nr:CoA-transferase [Sedimentibacter sp.]
MSNSKFTTNELMAVTASRLLKDGQNIVVGLGLPQVATLLAKSTHAPHLNIIFEIGVVNPESVDTGVGIADPRLWYRSDYFTSFIGSLGHILQRGLVDVGFLGGLQIDKFGNINSTGVYEKDYFRHINGSGGAADIASYSKNIFAIAKHQKRKIVDIVDFITTVGYLNGGITRENSGLPKCKSIRIITNLCVMNFNNELREMQIESIHPGVTKDQIIENTGFDIKFAGDLKETDLPDDNEIYLLRNVIDPRKLYI